MYKSGILKVSSVVQVGTADVDLKNNVITYKSVMDAEGSIQGHKFKVHTACSQFYHNPTDCTLYPIKALSLKGEWENGEPMELFALDVEELCRTDDLVVAELKNIVVEKGLPALDYKEFDNEKN